jgi:CrcB protein
VTTDLSAAGEAPRPDAPSTGGARSRRLHERLRKSRVQLVIVFALGLGGVVGAVARYAVSRALPVHADHFPWSTFLVNVSGSAILGFLLILMIEQFPRGRLARPVIGTGVIGAFTTFSTFEVDALLLFRADHPLVGATYVAASVFAGLAAVWMGMSAARLVLRTERWLQGEMQ